MSTFDGSIFFHFSLKFLNRKHGRCKTIDQRHFKSRKDTNCIGKIIWSGGFCHGSSRVQGNIDTFSKKTPTPFVREKLDTAMQPNNVKDKYAVAIFQEGKNEFIGHLPLGKSGKFSNNIYFLKACKEYKCQII